MPDAVSPRPPRTLPWTGDPEADRLLASDWVALLIGFVFDQQIPVQRAFSAPLELRRRLGTLDCHRLASLDGEELRRAVAGPPALHRFPTTMAQRVQELCRVLVERYGGDPSRIWATGDAAEVLRRLSQLPGFGPMKAQALLRLLTYQFGIPLAGAERYLPSQPTIAEVTTPAELEAYLADKRARKAAARAAGETRR